MSGAGGRVCIVGAGAIGGILAANLARAGNNVSVIARGAHLDAIRSSGLRLVTDSDDFTVSLAASDDPAALGPQDIVILAVKAPALPGLAPHLAPLFHPDTSVVTAMNGIPWWFCDAMTGPLAGRRLESVDPGGILSRFLNTGSVLGCVVHAGASVPEPGVVHHAAGNLFIVGDARRQATDEARLVANTLADAGLDGRATDDIHTEIWLKLIGNMGMGPICALTGDTLSGLAGDAGTRAIAAAMMEEAMAAGDALRLPLEMGVEARIDLGAELGAFKPSILQDLERERPLEIDAMVSVVAEMGAIAGIPTPCIDTILALLRGRARFAGLY
jgi:2-dehydropantoate 2-reductase